MLEEGYGSWRGAANQVKKNEFLIPTFVDILGAP